MYRLIKEVHWSGPVAPFKLMTTNVTGVVDNGDNTYTVTFDAPVQVVDPVNVEPAFILYSADSAAWLECFQLSQAGSNAVTLFDAAGNPGDTRFAIVGTPTTVTAALPFATASPIQAVT